MNGTGDFELYVNRLNVQDILSYAGYKFIRKDGLKYPCFQRIDSEGRRVRGDKFIVTQGGKCCFQPPVQKSFNVISLIKSHPELFPEAAVGLQGNALVNAVCRKILNMDLKDREITGYNESLKTQKPFNLEDYDLLHFDKDDKKVQLAFYPYFKSRGIGLMTQYLFRHRFCLATHETKSGKKITNLSLPLAIPGKSGIVGLEERSRPRLDGSTGYKGKAAGSNGSEGLWMASPNCVPLQKVKDVYWFESAYDAMAYFQTHIKNDYSLYKAMFVSTGGSLTVMQARGVLEQAPDATHHLCFDNDMAGRQFTVNFNNEVKRMQEKASKEQGETNSLGTDAIPEVKVVREVPMEGYKDWNEELLGEAEKKKCGTIRETVSTGVDLDGDGEEDTVEKEQNVEEKKYAKMHRHAV